MNESSGQPSEDLLLEFQKKVSQLVQKLFKGEAMWAFTGTSLRNLPPEGEEATQPIPTCFALDNAPKGTARRRFLGIQMEKTGERIQEEGREAAAALSDSAEGQSLLAEKEVAKVSKTMKQAFGEDVRTVLLVWRPIPQGANDHGAIVMGVNNADREEVAYVLGSASEMMQEDQKDSSSSAIH